jgi:Amidohydrolase family
VILCCGGARLLAEELQHESPIVRILASNFGQMFPLGDPPDYEPTFEQSVTAIASRSSRRPEEIAYDLLLEGDGKQFLFAPLANYIDFDFEALREMMLHPRTVLGLSDGGAHCGLICDASMPTFLLTHWVRDRRRGARIPLEQAIRLQTSNTAAVYGLTDRGAIAAGKKADLNVIDLDALHLHAPEMVFDLPAAGGGWCSASTAIARRSCRGRSRSRTVKRPGRCRVSSCVPDAALYRGSHGACGRRAGVITRCSRCTTGECCILYIIRGR